MTMNLPLRFARRYLFARRSTNAIHVITGIAVFGVSVGTAALILILSVFNGLEDLITRMYSAFDPDVKITPVRGKTFPVDSATLVRLRAIDGVELLSETLEEIAFFEYKTNQDFGTLRGVDDNWHGVTGIDTTLMEGRFALRDGKRELAVLGRSMRNKLAVNIDDPFASISIYMAKRREVSVFEEPFRRGLAYPAGTTSVQTEFGDQYVIVTLDLARNLLQLPGQVSALEVKLAPGTERRQAAIIEQIKKVMGKDFAVKSRYEQHETFLRLMRMEKWLSFAVVGLMVVLVAFNLIGTLWMIVLEKRIDIAILKSMGAPDRLVRNIFLGEGVLLTILGSGAGFFLALVLYWIQKTIGIVRLAGNFEAYPVSLRGLDFLVVFAVVAGIGLLASVPPALRAQREPAIVREE